MTTVLMRAPRHGGGATYGPGPCRKISKYDAARRVEMLETMIEENRREGSNGQRGEGRCETAVKVFRYLVNLRCTDGSRFPSLETIATEARVSLSSAKRAINLLEAFGVVRRVRRLVHVIVNGVRHSKIGSNAYEILDGIQQGQKGLVSKIRNLKKKKRAIREGGDASVSAATGRADGRQVAVGSGGVILEPTKTHAPIRNFSDELHDTLARIRLHFEPT